MEKLKFLDGYILIKTPAILLLIIKLHFAHIILNDIYNYRKQSVYYFTFLEKGYAW